MSDHRITFLNALANQPGIIHALAPGYRNLDLSAFFDRPGNVMLGDERGVMLFARLDNGYYEGHFVIMPGQPATKLLRGFAAAMFTDYAAPAIVLDAPIENQPARVVARALGFMPQGTSTSPSGRSCMHYILERDTWATFSAEQ